MGARGRKSGAESNVVSITGKAPRPNPPPSLTSEQAQECRAIVKRLPADWFERETHALLESYCRHIVTARRIAEQIERCFAETTAKTAGIDRLLKMQARESGAIAQLATKMRLSQQSGYCSKTASTAKKQRGSASRLWEDNPHVKEFFEDEDE